MICVCVRTCENENAIYQCSMNVIKKDAQVSNFSSNHQLVIFFFSSFLWLKKKPFCKTGALFESITAPYVISANAKGPVRLVAIVTCPGDGHLCGYGSSYNCISVYRHAMRRVEINLRVSCCTPARSRKFTQWKFTRTTFKSSFVFLLGNFFSVRSAFWSYKTVGCCRNYYLKPNKRTLLWRMFQVWNGFRPNTAVCVLRFIFKLC